MRSELQILILVVLFFCINGIVHSQKGKITTYYYHKELKESEGKLDKNGKRTGLWTFWNVRGDMVTKQNYENGILNGECIIEKFIIIDSMYLNKVKSDEKIYNQSMKRQSVSQLDSIFAKGNYKDGKKEGMGYSYNYKGKLISTTPFHNDMVNGESISYSPFSNDTIARYFYQNGKTDSIYEYDNDGNLKIRKIKYNNGELSLKCDNGKIYSSLETRDSNGITTIIKCNWVDGLKKDCKISKEKTKNETKELFIRSDENDVDVVIVENKNYKVVPSYEKVEVDEIFDVVEEMPQFPGGNAELYKFISSNYTMDSTMKAQAIAGKIYVSFVIDKDGSVTQAKVLRGLSEPLDNEALRVVNLMPKWVPGKQRGKEVKVRYNLPIVVKWN